VRSFLQASNAGDMTGAAGVVTTHYRQRANLAWTTHRLNERSSTSVDCSHAQFT
jgi:hypothetical protein